MAPPHSLPYLGLNPGSHTYKAHTQSLPHHTVFFMRLALDCICMGGLEFLILLSQPLKC